MHHPAESVIHEGFYCAVSYVPLAELTTFPGSSIYILRMKPPYKYLIGLGLLARPVVLPELDCVLVLNFFALVWGWYGKCEEST